MSIAVIVGIAIGISIVPYSKTDDFVGKLDSWNDRIAEEAEERLLATGADAIPSLLAALNRCDGEIPDRAASVLLRMSKNIGQKMLQQDCSNYRSDALIAIVMINIARKSPSSMGPLLCCNSESVRNAAVEESISQGNELDLGSVLQALRTGNNSTREACWRVLEAGRKMPAFCKKMREFADNATAHDAAMISLILSDSESVFNSSHEVIRWISIERTASRISFFAFSPA